MLRVWSLEFQCFGPITEGLGLFRVYGLGRVNIRLIRALEAARPWTKNPDP